MNKLANDKRVQIVTALVEGCSIRSTVRMTGASKNTIAKLLVELGSACADYLDKHLVNLNAKRIQCDELWSFIGAKEKNVTPEMAAEKFCGDAWTWVAIDADSKLICSWLIGKRDPATATQFIHDLSNRLKNRVQLTSNLLLMASNSILPLLTLHLESRSITRCLLRCTANRQSHRSATALPHASAVSLRQLQASPSRDTSAPAISNVRTSR
jgi:hypothetical protein